MVQFRKVGGRELERYVAHKGEKSSFETAEALFHKGWISGRGELTKSGQWFLSQYRKQREVERIERKRKAKLRQARVIVSGKPVKP